MSKIYLISPPKIDSTIFLPRLDAVLKTGLVSAFQLRLKDHSQEEIKKIAFEVKKICTKNGCIFLVNDFLEIALEVGANGVHVGLEDQKKSQSVKQIRKKSPKNFIIGVSCYDSRHLAIEGAEQGADYISFGTFFSSTTKNSQGKPKPEILKWADEILNTPTVAIGGITDQNCSSLVQAKADFLAVISFIWDHPLGEVVAVKKLDQAIETALIPKLLQT